jgi:hypothetical protein
MYPVQYLIKGRDTGLSKRVELLFAGFYQVMSRRVSVVLDLIQ